MNRKRLAWWMVGVLCAAAAGAQRAGAEWVEQQISPKATSDGERTFKIAVAARQGSPGAIAGSRFEFREQGWQALRDANEKPLRDEEGAPVDEQSLEGRAYWFAPSDFDRT